MNDKAQVRLQKTLAAIKRWEPKLRRAVNTLDRLNRTRRRLEKMIANPVKVKVERPKPVTVVIKPEPKPTLSESCDHIASAMIQGKSFEQANADLEIPGFLQRGKPDPVAVEIAREQEERKKAKARGRIAKLKAKQSGETRRMPLQGKEALALIRGGHSSSRI